MEKFLESNLVPMKKKKYERREDLYLCREDEQ